MKPIHWLKILPQLSQGYADNFCKRSRNKSRRWHITYNFNKTSSLPRCNCHHAFHLWHLWYVTCGLSTNISQTVSPKIRVASDMCSSIGYITQGANAHQHGKSIVKNKCETTQHHTLPFMSKTPPALVEQAFKDLQWRARNVMTKGSSQPEKPNKCFWVRTERSW